MKHKSVLHFFSNQSKDNWKKFVKTTKKSLKHLSRARKRLFLLVVVAIVGVSFTVGALGFTAYFSATPAKGIVKQIISIFPYPAAIVNGNIIRLSSWEREYFALKQASELQGGSVPDAQIREDVLEKMIFELMLEQLAQEYDIIVTEEDINAEVEAVVANDFDNREQLEEQVEELFGWDFDEFINRIVRPELLTANLNTELKDSPAVDAETKARAAEVLKLLKDGGSFSELAVEYSDDQSSLPDGALGWFGKDFMVPEFEEAAFALEAGQLSELVRTTFGYHIILVDETSTDEELGEQVKARHILIAFKGLDEFMQEFTDEAKVWRFIKYQ